MKVAAAIGAIGLCGAAAWTGVALADGLPTVPTPTVPPVTLPTPTLPSAPSPPPLPSPPKLPSAPSTSVVHAPSVGSATSGVVGSVSSSGGSYSSAGGSYSSAGGSSSSSSSSSSGSYSGAASGSTSPAHRPHASHVRATRTYIGKGRPATITFRLSSAGRVTIVVQELSPVCRRAARIRTHGRAGVNKISFGTRVGRHRLEPGTYRFTVKTTRRGRGKSIVLVVVAGGAPSPAQLASARGQNSCRGVLAAATSGGPTGGVFSRSGSTPFGGSTGAYRPRLHKGGGSRSGSEGTSATAAPPTPAAQTAPLLNPAEGPHSWLRMLLLAGFAAAALLLAVAAMPAAAARGTRAGEVVARRRAEITLLGGATLLAFAIAYLIATFV